MRTRDPLFVACALAAVLTACAPSPPAPVAVGGHVPMPEGTTAAFRDISRRHAADLAALPDSVSAGLWLVQDSAGHRLTSGVLNPFPTRIGSDDFASVVPEAAGHKVLEFGFARTAPRGRQTSVRVVYVTVRAGAR